MQPSFKVVKATDNLLAVTDGRQWNPNNTHKCSVVISKGKKSCSKNTLERNVLNDLPEKKKGNKIFTILEEMITEAFKRNKSDWKFL